MQDKVLNGRLAFLKNQEIVRFFTVKCKEFSKLKSFFDKVNFATFTKWPSLLVWK